MGSSTGSSTETLLEEIGRQTHAIRGRLCFGCTCVHTYRSGGEAVAVATNARRGGIIIVTLHRYPRRTRMRSTPRGVAAVLCRCLVLGQPAALFDHRIAIPARKVIC